MIILNLMRVYTHGVRHTDSESAQHFDLELAHIFLVLLMGFEPRSSDLESKALQIEPPHHLLLEHN